MCGGEGGTYMDQNSVHVDHMVHITDMDHNRVYMDHIVHISNMDHS